MFSLRRIIILLASVALLWVFFHASSSDSHLPFHDLETPRPPGRPGYPPFHPPPLRDPAQLPGHPAQPPGDPAQPPGDPAQPPGDPANPPGDPAQAGGDSSNAPSKPSNGAASDPNHPAKPPGTSIWAARAESVKHAFLHAYRSYEQYAPFPNDELMPLTNGSANTLNGWGLTLVDSLDTMLLLGLHDDFKQAASKVESLNFSMPQGSYAPFFETVIRYLGGLLSAYALSQDPVLLARAEELGTKLLPVFNTSSGIPLYGVNTQTNETHPSAGMMALFAEIASCQLEYKYLAHLTGREIFSTTVERVIDLLQSSQPSHGMWSTFFDVKTGTPTGAHHSVGAWADSAYEYLLKQYLISGKTEDHLAKLYMTAVRGILENLVFLSHTRNLLYITDTHDLVPTRKFEHLSCFFPGLLALGVSTLPDTIMSHKERELHMWAAEGLAHTCWIMYADQESGLGPEIVVFTGNLHGEGFPGYPTSSNYTEEKWVWHLEKWERDGRPGGKPPGVGNAGSPIVGSSDATKDYTVWIPSYLLRPETLESMFVMYRTTKDARWRERGWQIWEAIESKTRLSTGYASVYDVNHAKLPHLDSMPSYFLAETIKYAYLIAVDEDSWPADKFILNTEAHPLPVFKWDDWHQQSSQGVAHGQLRAERRLF